MAFSLKKRFDGKLATKRAMLSQFQSNLPYRWRPELLRMHGESNEAGLVAGLRCASLEGGFALWEEYNAESKRHISTLGDQAMEIKYEDFIANPFNMLRDLAVFCELNISEEMVGRVVQQVNEGRAYAYRERPELADFAGRVSQRLHPYGY